MSIMKGLGKTCSFMFSTNPAQTEDLKNHKKTNRLNPGSPKQEEKTTTEPQHSVFNFYFK